jgi:hypothetical protein
MKWIKYHLLESTKLQLSAHAYLRDVFSLSKRGRIITQ